MITNHVDKLPYQTQYKMEDLDEVDELAGEYEVFEQTEGGKFEQIYTTNEGKKSIIDVNPAQN